MIEMSEARQHKRDDGLMTILTVGLHTAFDGTENDFWRSPGIHYADVHLSFATEPAQVCAQDLGG
jgi:hypothetical protein